MTSTITGRAATDRAARYGKQLCSHLSRKIDAMFDAEAGTGTIRRGEAVATLTATGTALEFSLTAPTQDELFTLMFVAQSHLERFGDKDELACAWDDESVLPAYEALRAEREAERAARKAAEAQTAAGTPA
ncbi:DUF2218 domain-containing protein [Demequina salsinemoris]|uniref:DUF2218 domain-containing protein n=1 Tax=Demequina salsinemoris TaxID=577470 RepID=UPI000781FB88|nr:DUF2218 domain-containing protein [Demequina salsinemoris]